MGGVFLAYVRGGAEEYGVFVLPQGIIDKRRVRAERVLGVWERMRGGGLFPDVWGEYELMFFFLA